MIRFTLLLFLVSCGASDYRELTGKFTRHTTHVDFKPYIKRFEAVYGYSATPIIYADLDVHIAGICTIWRHKNIVVYKEITIDKKKWNSYNDEQRQTLVFHELGHCELGRKHENGVEDYCPISLMRSYMLNEYEINSCYVGREDYYLRELGK